MRRVDHDVAREPPGVCGPAYIEQRLIVGTNCGAGEKELLLRVAGRESGKRQRAVGLRGVGDRDGSRDGGDARDRRPGEVPGDAAPRVRAAGGVGAVETGPRRAGRHDRGGAEEEAVAERLGIGSVEQRLRWVVDRRTPEHRLRIEGVAALGDVAVEMRTAVRAAGVGDRNVSGPCRRDRDAAHLLNPRCGHHQWRAPRLSAIARHRQVGQPVGPHPRDVEVPLRVDRNRVDVDILHRRVRNRQDLPAGALVAADGDTQRVAAVHREVEKAVGADDTGSRLARRGSAGWGRRYGIGERVDEVEARAAVERSVTNEDALRRPILQVRAVVDDVRIAHRLRPRRRRRSFQDFERALTGTADLGVRHPVLALVVAPRDRRAAQARQGRGEPEAGSVRVDMHPRHQREVRRRPGVNRLPARAAVARARHQRRIGERGRNAVLEDGRVEDRSARGDPDGS